ncbi:hypothetical protein ACLOJK_019505, partial [Asimina triloba]
GDDIAAYEMEADEIFEESIAGTSRSSTGIDGRNDKSSIKVCSGLINGDTNLLRGAIG